MRMPLAGGGRTLPAAYFRYDISEILLAYFARAAGSIAIIANGLGTASARCEGSEFYYI